MTDVLDRPAAPADTSSRVPKVPIRQALWTVPPLLVVFVVAVYPLIRVCLESAKLGRADSGWEPGHRS